jgi:hypothetical protein
MQFLLQVSHVPPPKPALSEGVEGSPQADRSEACPEWDVETQGSNLGRHRDRRRSRRGGFDGRVLDEVAHLFDPPDHAEGSPRVLISHHPPSARLDPAAASSPHTHTHTHRPHVS